MKKDNKKWYEVKKNKKRPKWCTCKEDYIPRLHTAHCLYRKIDKDGIINRCNIKHDHSEDYGGSNN